MKRTFNLTWAVFFLLLLSQLISCKKEEEEPDVIASFTFQVDANDFMKVAFTNQSSNFSALLWNFGDNSATSTETNPVHTFPDLGDYTVKLTATSLNGQVTDEFTATVTITDPNAELTKLVGETSKTWKLIRVGTSGRYPIQVFQYNLADPANPVTNWWAMGLGNDELANRPCMLNDEWTFFRDGTLDFKANGDYWAEGGVFSPDNICASTSDPMVSGDGEDLSAWKDGTHQFEFLPGEGKLKAIGTGAFIGFIKLATDYEIMDLDPMVPDMVEYDVYKLTDGTTDTLIIQGHYYDNPETTTEYLGTWRFCLVHYDNPDDEPFISSIT
ncbi:MAG: PKD domain-containing protein, partial [Bacteroidales bacterium]|nr:PKD domain-containing protein [Bacteroidales bacterium]